MNPTGGIDLDALVRAEKANTDPTQMQLPPNMQRGVDLNVVRHKKYFQHRWVAVAKFVITDQQMNDMVAQMDAIMVEVKRKTEAGEDATVESLGIPLMMEQLMGVDGPGCIKCNLHFAHPEGHGKLCSQDDRAHGITDPDIVKSEGGGEGELVATGGEVVKQPLQLVKGGEGNGQEA